MRNKKIIFILISVLLAVTLLSAACIEKSYGKAYDSLDELITAMFNESLTFLYPAYMGETNEKSTKAYIGNTGRDGITLGYKLYSFGAPFFVSVCSYKSDEGVIKSDDAARLMKEESFQTEKGEAELYTGKGHKDALFLIGAIVLDGKRYEVRVTSNKETVDNNFVNAIYKDNSKYGEALNILKLVIESLQG